MSASIASAPKEVAGVQYARGAAALLVVIFHVAEQMDADPIYGRLPHPLLAFGFVGVPIFFVISGFIITLVSLDRELHPRLSRTDFAMKRILRIAPFMWLVIIAYNFESFVATRMIDWGAAARAMVLWPAGTVKPNVIWTLRHEAIFYVLFATSFLARRRYALIMVGWCFAPAIIFATQPQILGLRDPQIGPSFFQILLSDMNFMFGAGILLGLYVLKSPVRMSSTWAGGAALVYTLAFLVVLFAWFADLRSGFSAYAALTVLSTLMIYAAIRVQPSNSPFNRLAALLGSASYAIYLVHNMIVVPSLIIGHLVVRETGIWPLFLASTTAAVIGGILAHIYVEKPLSVVVNRKTKRKFRTNEQPPVTGL